MRSYVVCIHKTIYLVHWNGIIEIPVVFCSRICHSDRSRLRFSCLYTTSFLKLNLYTPTLLSRVSPVQNYVHIQKYKSFVLLLLYIKIESLLKIDRLLFATRYGNIYVLDE